MTEFGGVFFQMDPGYADAFGGQFITGKAFDAFAADIDAPFGTERHIVLADLIVFRQVRIKIAFAVKLAETGDFAPGKQTGDDRFADSFFVGYGQSAGIPHTDRTGMSIGFSPESIGT